MEELIALQKKLFVYKGRRKEILKEFGSSSPSYHRMRHKTDNIRKTIKKLENKTAYIREIDNLMYEFIGHKPSKDSKRGTCLGTMNERYARSIFYKHLIENGISGAVIAKYCNVRRTVPTDSRRRFTRSFTTNKENLEMWRRWRLFLKHKKEIL